MSLSQTETHAAIEDRGKGILRRQGAEAEWSFIAGMLLTILARRLSHPDGANTWTVAVYLSCVAWVLLGFTVYRSISLCKQKQLTIYRVVLRAVFMLMSMLSTIELLIHAR
jgi:hypothetical protein